MTVLVAFRARIVLRLRLVCRTGLSLQQTPATYLADMIQPFGPTRALTNASYWPERADHPPPSPLDLQLPTIVDRDGP